MRLMLLLMARKREWQNVTLSLLFFAKLITVTQMGMAYGTVTHPSNVLIPSRERLPRSLPPEPLSFATTHLAKIGSS